MSDDYIPRPDDGFAHFAVQFITYAGNNTAACKMVTADITELGAVVNPWSDAWAAYLAAKVTFDEALVAKDAARAAAEPVLREKSGAVQANPAVADEARVGLGLPIHKTTRTPVPPIETHPVLVRVDNEHLLQRLWFADQTTPGSRAKPKGAAYCEIRELLVAPGGAAPTNPDAMQYLANDSKSPYRNDLDPGDVGKTAYYAVRWVNTTGQPGPWGLITGYLVN